MKHQNIPLSKWLKYDMYFMLQHILGHANMTKNFGAGKNKLDSSLNQKLSGNQEEFVDMEVTEVQGAISYQDFMKLRSKPIVFRGMASDWGCCQKWSYDFFKENYGQSEVLLNDNVGLIDYDNPQQFEKLLLADYVDLMKTGSLKYLKFCQDLLNKHEELRKDINTDMLRSLWLPNAFREEMVFFMSGKDTMTPMHSAPSSNFFIQVDGKKVWTMFPPEDWPLLDIRTNRTYYYYSKVDPDKRGDNFELSKYARRYRVTLDKGDVLWVPPFTWHHVYNPTPAIGVSYRYLSLGEAFRNSTLLMLMVFFATKPSPFVHLYMSIFKKQSAIFTKSAT